MSALVRFAGRYEFQAVATGGWTVYLNDLTIDECEPIGHWDTLKEAHDAVKAPPFDDGDDSP